MEKQQLGRSFLYTKIFIDIFEHIQSYKAGKMKNIFLIIPFLSVVSAMTYNFPRNFLLTLIQEEQFILRIE